MCRGGAALRDPQDIGDLAQGQPLEVPEHDDLHDDLAVAGGEEVEGRPHALDHLLSHQPGARASTAPRWSSLENPRGDVAALSAPTAIETRLQSLWRKHLRRFLIETRSVPVSIGKRHKSLSHKACNRVSIAMG